MAHGTAAAGSGLASLLLRRMLLLPPMPECRERHRRRGAAAPPGIPGDDELTSRPRDANIEQPQPLADIVEPRLPSRFPLAIGCAIGADCSVQLGQCLGFQVQTIAHKPALGDEAVGVLV